MSDDQTMELQVVRQFSASAERVFDAWLDASTAAKWLFATPTGQMVRMDIDARVGGKFCITRRDTDDIDHVGEYLELDRPKRLVFTFAVPRFSTEYTTVAIDIAPYGPGCHLTLTQAGVLPEWAERSKQGWTMMLDNLAKQVD